MTSRLRAWHRRHDFALRLLGTLALTLVIVGSFQYVVSSRDAESRLRDWATRSAQGDVVFIQQAFDSGDDEQARTAEMNKRLVAIQNRSGIRHVLLLDRFGVVTAASEPERTGSYWGGPAQRQVLRDGVASAEVAEADGLPVLRYIVPVELPTGRFALVVEQDASVNEEQLAALQRSSMYVVGMGIAVGVVLFFLLGGRSLGRTYRRAIRLSTQDALTDLGNHRRFQEAMATSVAAAASSGAPLSLALIDLDDFKLINDRLGHREGDEVLRATAALLTTGRAEDRAFRIGGDEFAMILADTDAEGAIAVCRRLWSAVNAGPGGVTVSVGTSTLSPGLDAVDLHERADAALYEAKRRGRNGVVAFEDLAGSPVIPAEKVRAVRQMLQDQVLGTAYQPIWDLGEGRILGYEALARPDKMYGLSGPGEMYSIGELIGRTHDLDALSWQRALESARSLPEDVLLFLNMSPFTADHGDEPVDRLHDVVLASGVPAQRIVVELTEKWSGHRAALLEQAERLRGFGFRLALDDVGAGSGDLEMMARLPVEFIKVDMSVVQKARLDATARGVLFAITAFAAHSSSSVIAEGIEDEVTLDYLRHNTFSCPSHESIIRGAQGYHLGRPEEGARWMLPEPLPGELAGGSGSPLR